MRSTIVEIFSDQANASVMRHPDRRFPGVLVQGDSLYAMCLQADAACANAKQLINSDNYDELNDLRNRLWDYLNHYKAVLGEHKVPLPFRESAGA
ncbi:hypothetical protein M3O57_02540 [Xanthomonas nasturtii]|uniref:DUF3077 domain-containing protein n=1 Tax=Xanthomonas nasturtii TaxID=1843581 RepID=A0ABT0LRX9_9XANT|nr:hypothetical protein [Xanthomonas nasturtii]MCL1499263.1 hypothetical protein [Xanthomonas nasturtii]MCL1502882.1 hypothetical protein [Xanthomonas nasturtii]MCL1529007.1 hypothetical protein [Xanthomonas nasturtii]MCL1552103.1 hypothetical protein [Xanthomonas nasturtii]MCL1556373.1 hypothetical protein [Xanthomonas nasturtii]